MSADTTSANSSATAQVQVRVTVRLRSSVAVELGAEGALLRHPWGATFVRARPEVCAILDALSHEALDTFAVAERLAGGRPVDDTELIMWLAQLEIVLDRVPFLVTRGVSSASGAVVTVEPLSDRAPAVKPVELAAESSVSLDRFAYLRRRSEIAGLCLESPLALHRAQLGQSIVPLIARIAAAPAAVAEIVDERERAALQLLAAAGLIHAGSRTEVEDERLATWSFHDLLFHAYSRPGRRDDLFGAHFRHHDRIAAPPAVPPARTGRAVDLPRPAFAQVVASDRSMTEVIESRNSVREYGAPLAVEQLAELLYRSARTRRVVTTPGPGSYDGADHPYPTGGLAGDLELYLCVARCAGLAPGIYHYESAAHRLRWINELETAAPLLAAAQAASAGIVEPQVLVTITSRFARTAWKYEAIAYALTLKHVGVLLQTMYLVATSMGLAPCALGSGDADRSARAFGLDWLVESSVGELVLGSRVKPVTWADGFADVVTETRTSSANAS
jgi:SagB-type dehydrogenase family enzyme